jgi:hypothetical protein
VKITTVAELGNMGLTLDPSHPGEVIATRDARLMEFAKLAWTEHDAVVDSIEHGIEHARQCGTYLLECKKQKLAPHGQFGEWLDWWAAQKGIKRRMAQIYVLIARRWDELQDRAKAQRIALLRIGTAVDLLRERRTSKRMQVATEEGATPKRREQRQHGPGQDPTASQTGHLGKKTPTLSAPLTAPHEQSVEQEPYNLLNIIASKLEYLSRLAPDVWRGYEEECGDHLARIGRATDQLRKAIHAPTH